jgi:hypothetical protein
MVDEPRQSDADHPNAATISALLNDIAVVYPVFGDSEKWVKTRARSWWGILHVRTCGELRRAWDQWRKTEDHLPTPAALLALCNAGRTMSEERIRIDCPRCEGGGWLTVLRVRGGAIVESVARCSCEAGSRMSSTVPRADDVATGIVCTAGDYGRELRRLQAELGMPTQAPAAMGALAGMNEPDRYPAARAASLQAEARREAMEDIW